MVQLGKSELCEIGVSTHIIKRLDSFQMDGIALLTHVHPFVDALEAYKDSTQNFIGTVLSVATRKYYCYSKPPYVTLA